MSVGKKFEGAEEKGALVTCTNSERIYLWLSSVSVAVNCNC